MKFKLDLRKVTEIQNQDNLLTFNHNYQNHQQPFNTER